MRRRGSLLGLLLVIGGLAFLIPHFSSVHRSSSAVTADIAVGSSESSWISSLLTSLGDPHTAADENSVADWIRHETLNWPPEDPACGSTQLVVVNNPLNTGQPEPGSTMLSCNGVRVYPDLSVGLQGTVDTLDNGRYGDILAQLKSGAGLGSGASGGLSAWSNGGYTSVLATVG